MAARFVMPERAFDTHYEPHTLYRAEPASGAVAAGTGDPNTLESSVQGPNRHKYMKRPIVPFLHAVPPDILLAPPTVQAGDTALGAGGGAVEQKQLKKTVATQSDYRESEAQTAPYTTDHVVPEGQEPEILSLERFTWGNGLPIGANEVGLIERARFKRLVEGNYPPATDDRSYALRSKQMEQLQTRNWDDREADLKAEQDERLAKLEQALDARSNALQAKHEARLDQLRQVKLLQSENEVALVQKRRIKAFRKLAEAQKHMVPEKRERQIVEEYANYGSQQYAPIRREGQSRIQDKGAEKFEVEPQQLSSLEAVTELEQTMPGSLVKTTAKPEMANSQQVGYSGRRALLNAQHLDKVHSQIRAQRAGPVDNVPSDRAEVLKRYHKPPPLERPGTPRVEPEQQEHSVQAAAVLLQQLLRGRLVQNQVWEAKEKRRQLVEELRSIEQLEGGQDAWEQQQQQDEQQLHTSNVRSGAAMLLIGDAVGRSLDFLSKELVHCQEEERLRSIMEQAEQMRAAREQAESSQREAEQAERAENDEVYAQLHRTHQQSADAFLDALLPEIMQQNAERRALQEIAVKSDKLDSVIGELEKEMDDPGSVMQDLVAHFLLPEVEREQKRWEKRETQNKYKKAAYDALTDELSNA